MQCGRRQARDTGPTSRRLSTGTPVRSRNRPAAALERVEAALRRHPLASMPAADRPYPELARFYARAGRLDQAKRLVAEFERNVTEGLRRGVSLRHAAAADIALSEGR